jgi:aspartyl-tRNA(Asn)/glutamyl-tRNA(Gln) amidotransferase subunit A
VTDFDPATLTIVEAARRLRDGTLTSVALTEACLARIAQDGARPDGARLNAFILVTADLARMQAAEADRERAGGVDRGPLHGIPISLKDLIDLAGTPTTAGSRVRAGHVATSDAPIVTLLRNAGAVIVGKTNLHEFAMGTTNEDSAFGPARHPLDPSRSPGGSSGGSAVSVVTGMCLGSVGSDTGGSIRIPSAACGLVGLKAAFGEVSADGVVPLSRSLDHVGPLARTVADARLLFEILAGGDGHDALAQELAAARASNGSAQDDAPGQARGAQRPASLTDAPGRSVSHARTPVRAFVPSAYFLDRLQTEVRASFEAALARLRDAGVDIASGDVPHARQASAIYLPICLAEAAAWHAPTLDTLGDAYTVNVRLRIEMGRYVLATDYVRAQRGREVLRAEVDALLAGADVLLLPTLPILAPPIGAATVPLGDGTEEPVRAAMLRLTQPFNLTGHPAITIPMAPAQACASTNAGPGADAGADAGAGQSAALPCGLQIVARDTRQLLRYARLCEQALNAASVASQSRSR